MRAVGCCSEGSTRLRDAAQQRAYFLANKARINETRRLKYASDPERFRARGRVGFDAAAAARMRAAHRAYFLANKARINAQERERNAANRDRVRAYQRARRVALRAEVLAAYGGRCTCCGEAENHFLALDHVAGDGAAHRREIAKSVDGGSLYRWAKLNGYPPSLQIHCHNCNLAKGFYGQCPHQARAAKAS